MTRTPRRVTDALDRFGDLPRYTPGAGSDGVDARKLSSNESAYGTSPAVREALTTVIGGIARYPTEADVHAALADHLDVDPASLVLTNGSDELCALVAAAFITPGSRVVLSAPAYAIDWKQTVFARAEQVRVPLTDGAHDLDAMAHASRGAALVWLPTPHNPTGVAAPAADLDAFLARVDPECVVVLDEAYRGYADAEHRPDITRLLTAYPNLVVQRTFSKDHALAGLRVGYGLASAEITGLLRAIRAPFSVNALALAAVEAVLSERAGHGADAGAVGWHDLAVDQVIRERTRLQALLTELGIEHYPSQANFVTARIPHAALAAALDTEQISLRPGENLDLPGWVRITVGTPQDMAVLRSILKTYCPDSAATHDETAPDQTAPRSTN